MKMIFTIAWRNVWRNKRRSIITISSIFFAVFFAVFMRSFQEGSYDNMIENMVGKYTGHIQIHKDGYWKDQSINNLFVVKEDKLKQIQEQYQDLTLSKRLENFALSAYESSTKGALIIGTDIQKELSAMKINLDSIKGEIPINNDNSLLLSEGLASFYNIEIGDSLVILSQGYHGASGNGIFPVSGIIKHSLPQINDRLILIPLVVAQELFDAPNMLSSISIRLNNSIDIEELKKSLISTFHGDNLEVMNWKELLPELVQSIVADKAGGIVIIGVLYMIIAFGILGTLLMMTSERMHEFGILVSLGMKKNILMLTLLLESLFLGLISSVLGIIAASPICYYFHVNPIRLQGKAAEAIEAYGFEPVVPSSIDIAIGINQALIVFTILMVCSLYPLWKIFRLHPVKAMKS